MNSPKLVIPMSILLLSTLLVSATGSSGARINKRKIALEAGGPELIVPKGKIWKVAGLNPYSSERGVGTADLYIDGQIFVGKDKAYTIHGKFDICINDKQTSPLWILEESKVSVGDSRGRLTIEEYEDSAAED